MKHVIFLPPQALLTRTRDTSVAKSLLDTPRAASTPTLSPSRVNLHNIPFTLSKAATIPSSTSSRPATRWWRRICTMPFRLALLLNVSFIILFILAALAANATWQDFQDSKREWSETSCTFADEDPTRIDTDGCVSGRYDARALVKNIDQVETDHEFNLEKEDDFNVARQTSQRCIYDSKEGAEEFAEDIEAGETRACYTNGRFIRLTPGGFEDEVILGTRLRAIFAIVASIIAGLAVVYALHHLRLVSRFSRQEPETPNITRASRVARTPHTYRRPLSVADTRMLVSSLEEGHDGGACPICLDEFSDDLRKTRKLPCGHAYHEECALQWFRKGNASCPYCNHDLGDEVQRLRDAEDAEARNEGHDDSSGSSGTLTSSHWPAALMFNTRPTRRDAAETGS